MSKEFNPDSFLAETAPIAEAQADIERRNQERAASGQAPLSPAEVQGAMSPSGPSTAPKPAEFGQEPGRWAVENVIAPTYGAGKVAIDATGKVLSNPLVQHGLEIGGGGYAAKRLLINPIVEAIAGKSAPAAPVPAAPAPAAAPVAPAQPAMPAQAANAARGAAQAAQPGNWMAQALQMAKQYAPAMARVGTGLGAATYSGGLNTNEQAELNRRRAMEVEQARRQGWIR